jgi:flagellar protein FlbD
MIKVTRLNREKVFVNADLIEYVETTPDTVISLTTGEKFMVLETPDQVVDLVVDYERRIHAGPVRTADMVQFAEALSAVNAAEEKMRAAEESVEAPHL